MTERLLKIRISILAVLVLVAVFVWLPNETVRANDTQYLTVEFLDVGQGDAIHVMTPDGYELLIDGGPSSLVLRELAKNRSFFDKDIDVMIATHPDSDHIAGLVDVLERYQIGMILNTAVESDSQVAKVFGDDMRAEGAYIVTAKAGQLLQLGASTTVRILSPAGDTAGWETNTASVVVQLVYEDIEFMLTGDAPISIENFLVNQYGESLESEVLKLGHHGSKTSTSEEFLEAIKPDYAVVSAGKNNRYGHPKSEVIDRVQERGVEILNTIEQGSITFKSDGTKVWVE